jgi:arylsulfatase A-like enzyme
MEHGFEPEHENQGQLVFSRHVEASMEEPFTKAAYLGERAAQFIEARGDEPFALCVSYLEPHPPHTGPLNELYDPASLPVSPAFLREPPADAPLILRLMAAYYRASEEYGLDLRTDAGWWAVMARYWGNVSLVDRSVGRILAALEAKGLADDTIVVFTSDHGEQMGDHGLLGKTVMYEESVRVPLLIRAPALGTEARRVGGNCSHIDLVPSLLELMGQPLPPMLQGASRVSEMASGVDVPGDVFIEWNGADGHPPSSFGEAEVNRSMAEPSRTVVTADRWKLNLYQSGPGELYDLTADPHELDNLFANPCHVARRSDLAQRILAWQQETDDVAPVAVP